MIAEAADDIAGAGYLVGEPKQAPHLSLIQENCCTYVCMCVCMHVSVYVAIRCPCAHHAIVYVQAS